MAKKRATVDLQYDVALSFAGENRRYVERVAKALRSKGIRVFYDTYERVELWGKDLYAHLDDVYRSTAHYCVMFISSHYERKLWTNHERRSAQARAFRENREYVLPARFDDTAIPGVPDTIGYIDLRRTKAVAFANMVIKKLGPRQMANYVPPHCDLLYRALRAKSVRRQMIIQMQANIFAQTLQRMGKDERYAFLLALSNGCAAELPNNTHVSLDLLKRCSGFTISKIKRLLLGMVSLGIHCQIRRGVVHEYGSEGEMAFLDYDIRTDADYGGNAISVAYEMIHLVVSNYCPACEEKGIDVLLRCDFSQLSSATASVHAH